jgi:cytochrome P450
VTKRPQGGCPVHQLGGARFQQNPAELYRDMRRQHGGIAPVLLEGGVPAWLVIGYRELHQVTSNPALFARDSRRWNAWGRIPQDWPLLPMIGYEQPSVLYTEGPEHQRRAGVISDALGGVDTYELRDHCEQFADGLIDSFCGTRRADLIADYAHPLPLLVLVRIFGIPDAEGPALVQAINAMMDGGEDALRAQEHLHTSMRQLLAAKRRRPGPDITSRMVHHVAGYTDEEITQDLMVLMAAGHQPTAGWMGNTLRLMLTDDRFAASLSGGRRSIGQAMNEVLWEDTPTQNFAGRFATRDIQIGGARIQTGDLLVLGLAAANADPQVRPDARSLAEGNNAYLSFSHGDHRCPYPAQEIAESIARAGVEVLLDRLPDVRLAVPDDALVWRRSAWLRGLSALPVEFTPTPVVGRGAGSR